MGLKKEEWHGDRIIRLWRAASGEATVEMADEVAKEMRRVAHVKTEALKTSIHVALPETNGSVVGAETRVVGKGKHAREVGSWLPYACVENNRGGSHAFADIGWQLARAKFRVILGRAWRRPGL